MNRFRVTPGREEEFIKVWRERETFLDQTAGFRRFRLLQGETGEEQTLFISYAEWDSREQFSAWTESEQFAAAHRKGRTPEGVILGPPRFEGYEVVLEQ